MPTFSPTTVITVVATAAVSAAAGWSAREPAAPEAAVPVVATAQPAQAAAPAPAPAAAAAPLIAVSGDGNVTLRVEQQPLEWVLEQIAAQSGWGDVKERARPAPAAPSGRAPSPDRPADEVACAPAVQAAADPQRILMALGHPAEEQRFDALAQSRSDGVPVPEPVLRALMDADPSARVRLAAFESLLESRADERLFREALQAALLAPAADIQREARRRLDELQEAERLAAQAVRGAPP